MRPLSPDQLTKVGEWVATKVRPSEHPCPACRQRSNWGVQKDVIFGPIVGKGNQGMIFVVATCDNCAYVLLFNAYEIGLQFGGS